ncbi:Putative alpha helix protein [Candidatus Enterovibrio altilux]|uniref:Alpha helix protein n=2 Tax=Candidatus Enterovibrio altilux TaxID=1927128 RepID=A0A291B8F5_9GAMM|nr:Putative alpha helix protein [Candidatus Enterovibrio luxaltus]
MKALQKLGAQLVDLKPAILAKFPLEENLRIAIVDAQHFKKEARRRQLQFIGKIMRTADLKSIQVAFHLLNNKHGQQSIELQKLGKLRDRLITEGDKVINDVVKQYASTNRQKLRQLVRQAKKELEANKFSKASKEIFHMLRILKTESEEQSSFRS